MPFGLLKYGLSSRYPGTRLLPPRTDLKPAYDVVIIGAGGHGLATAYHMAKDHGIRDVAVLDKGYLGGGNTGRNTAIIRANYLTPESVRFYAEALELWRGLSTELDLNVQYAERGHLTLAHSDAAMRTMRWRAEVNTHLGVDSEVIYPNELARLVPGLDLSDSVRHPILGALHHPPGATARHDAVVWGYAARAAENGVELHPHTEVTGVLQEGGRVRGVETTGGVIRCNRVLQAVAGSSTLLAAMAGFRLPIHTVPLQACVSLPLKPFLDPIVVSASLHVYIWQTARGELVLGGATDPYGLYRNRSTLDFKESLLAHVLELFPFLSEVTLLRQWAGICDLTPDFSPVMGETPLENYYLDAGWGTWGFKATPVCGTRMAETIASGRVPDILRPFALARFAAFQQVGEKGAAAVGH